MDKLKLCPFCGEEAEVMEVYKIPKGGGERCGAAIWCPKCEASSRHRYGANAAKSIRLATIAWNRRTAGEAAPSGKGDEDGR